MTALSVVGGVYVERAIWPDWNQVFGSAGRAAAAVQGHVDDVQLYTYARTDVVQAFAPAATTYGFTLRATPTQQVISFDYTHSLSTPLILPPLKKLVVNPPIEVSADLVLRFGMLEGTAVVDAKHCVYDPQDQFFPEPFGANGSRAEVLAIVCNQAEALALTGSSDRDSAAATLIEQGAGVVVIKAGPRGAFIYTPGGLSSVPAYQTENVWTVGSGDVFAALFAARWGVHGDPPEIAAEIASRAVAEYVETMALPAPAVATLMAKNRTPLTTVGGTVYLASPFFSMGERLVVEEARRAFLDLGMSVFSPFHDVGPGEAASVAPKDLAALDSCDLVFAVLDGLDSGTVFEVGYARKAGKPVYVLAQAVSTEDLKMVEGSGCKVFADFVTAVHHAVWRA